MNTNFLLCSALVGLIVSGQAPAAPTWYKNYTLVSTGYYWDGSNDVWSISWQEPINTGCAKADNEHIAAYYVNPANDPNINRFQVAGARISPALMGLALNGNLKVDLMLDPAICSSTYGAKWQGLRLHK